MAVPQRLLGTLEEEGVEAVLGHEFGHLTRRDITDTDARALKPPLTHMHGAKRGAYDTVNAKVGTLMRATFLGDGWIVS